MTVYALVGAIASRDGKHTMRRRYILIYSIKELTAFMALWFGLGLLVGAGIMYLIVHLAFGFTF